ncbi:hypothetical protein J3F83DRAFT_133652 [Trichoderma novae-zelandiae]
MDFARASGAIPVFRPERTTGDQPGERPSRTRAVLETSSANKAQGSDACNMHECMRGTTLATLPVRCVPQLARLVSLLPVIIRDQTRCHILTSCSHVLPGRPIHLAAWWHFGHAHSKKRHHKTGDCSQSVSRPLACRPYLRPTKIAGPSPERLLTLQMIAAVIAWGYSTLIRAISPQGADGLVYETSKVLPGSWMSKCRYGGFDSMVAPAQVMVTSSMRQWPCCLHVPRRCCQLCLQGVCSPASSCL